MTQLMFETDWAEMTGTDRPEIIHTYAHLKISVGSTTVTTAHRRDSGTISDRLLISLYPLAEWIAANWWTLTEESELPGRTGFLDRHAMNRGRSGYCVPDLRFSPEGDDLLVKWVAYNFQHAPIDFITDGSMRLMKEHVEDVLRGFVDKVCDRLGNAGITDSWMQEEWASIQKTICDTDETEFCKAAAWLGRDPYDLSDDDANQISSLYSSIPEALREDAFRASATHDASEIATWIRDAVSKPPSNGATAKTLQEFRASLSARKSSRPWKVGYELASEVRRRFRIEGLVPTPLEKIFDGELPISHVSTAPTNVDALCFLQASPVYQTAKPRSDSLRFVVARGLYDYFSTDAPYSLLTTARTERQKENRAFAAELLAPADELRLRVRREQLTSDELLDLASEFDVSSHVVAHQIRNNEIAEVLTD